MLTFQERVRRRTEELRTEIESLIDQTRLLEAELTRLKAAEEVYTSMMEAAETPPTEAEVSAGSESTLSGAIADWMRDHGGFGRVATIYKDLWKAGRLRAKNPKSAYTQVYSTLKRHEERFREVGGGMWALVDAAEVDSTYLNRHLAPGNGLIAHGESKSQGLADWSVPMRASSAGLASTSESAARQDET